MRCLIFLFFCNISFAQDIETFNNERKDLDKNLMLALGTWATANIAVGTYGWISSEESEYRYFHMSNTLWNTVNLGLAIPGYIQSKKVDAIVDRNLVLDQQRKTERIFLINSGLDVGYICAGLLLSGSGNYKLSGVGKSLVLQGGFLFAFDLSAYTLHRRHVKRSGLIQGVQFYGQPYGVGCTIRFN